MRHNNTAIRYSSNLLFNRCLLAAVKLMVDNCFEECIITPFVPSPLEASYRCQSSSPFGLGANHQGPFFELVID